MLNKQKIFIMAAALIMILIATAGGLQAEQDKKAGGPATWQASEVGEINLYIPSNWKTMPGAPTGQGMWYLGEAKSPQVVLSHTLPISSKILA